MKALALRLAGPLQSWGGLAAGDDRPTLDVPTKSGVLGLVASALGIDRANTPFLHALHERFALAVRVDRRGPLEVDFQTIEGAPERSKSGGVQIRDGLVLSRRQLHHDCAFTAVLVELHDDGPPLGDIAHALRHPRWLPFLGRRACVPSEPILFVDAAKKVGPILEAETLRELFALVPPLWRATWAKAADLHVEERLLGDERGYARKVRDGVFPRGQRLFAERVVVRVPEGAAEAPRAAAAEDTVGPWF